MTILTVLQRASSVIGIERPTTVFASPAPEIAKLLDIAQDMATEIARYQEWSVLKRLLVYTGNGENTEFDLPADFDRLPVKQGLWSSLHDWKLTFYEDTDEWLEMLTRGYLTAWGSWTLLGGQAVFSPAPANGETIQFYYLTNRTVIDETDMPKAEFTADSDRFRLDERLLRLGIVWRWKADNGLPSGDAEADYMTALQDRAAKDGGARSIRIGRAAFMRGVRLAYPKNIPV